MLARDEVLVQPGRFFRWRIDWHWHWNGDPPRTDYRIDVNNGKEHHSFLLSRFVIGDYQRRYNITQQSNGYMLTKTILQNTIGSGLIDLVQDAPESHVTHLLAGRIRQLDMRLILRYKNHYLDENNHLSHTIERKVQTLDTTGLYDILLQFNKRVGWWKRNRTSFGNNSEVLRAQMFFLWWVFLFSNLSKTGASTPAVHQPHHVLNVCRQRWNSSRR